jgi:hypothetical protein
MTGYTKGLVAIFLYKQSFNEAIPAYPSLNWIDNRMDVIDLYVLIPYALRA